MILTTEQPHQLGLANLLCSFASRFAERYTNTNRRNLNMEVNIKTLLHPRIEKHCETLFDDGHYKHAASEAMIQVELALKEKSGEKKKFGVNLTSSLFGADRGIKNRVQRARF